ncbi:uncharacterized protein LOC105829705 [Monomorium pharaonis]|uniref:uncharacterized protein LOC105829705 n=1 Tax=Monomorium pharaonis TaxID=307658 RepID=UPI00063FAD3E|nr:uncharacterized protein LOC105829705 [Monomorium pharaonis]
MPDRVNMDRARHINSKRSALKAQLTSLERLVEGGNVSESNLKRRLQRVTDLLHAYEELHHELEAIEPGEHANEIDDIQNRYYAVASAIDDRTAPATSTSNLNIASTPVDNNIKRVKLPVAELPKFDGNLEKWLSLKNTFLTMIDSRDDITDLQKFLYLKDSLRGSALDKISIFDASDEGYKAAWQLLIESYEKKRILMTKHLDEIIDTLFNACKKNSSNANESVQSKVTAQDLTKLADTVRQHIATLKSLDIESNPHIIVRLMERALPPNVRAEWDKTLNLQDIPTLEQLYEFISETVFRVDALETNVSGNERNNKRSYPKGGSPATKTRRDERGARAFVTTPVGKCLACRKGAHPLFRCTEFEKLSLSRRWEIVKRTRVCKNCLKSHNVGVQEFALQALRQISQHTAP